MNFNDHGIIGTDISTWQDSPYIPGTVNFEKMKSYGASFVGFRASNGVFRDVDFDTYRQNVGTILPWFAYHFYNNLYEPKSQARKFIEVLSPNIPVMCVLDLEDKSSGYVGLHHWYNFLEEFKRLSGLSNDRIIIYTNETYIDEMAGRVTSNELTYLNRYKLWLASYVPDPIDPDYSLITTPFPWQDSDVLMVQTGTPDIGIEMGVESREIDYNIFNGDNEKFEQIFGVPPTEPGEPMEITLTADLLSGQQSRVRSAPTLSGAIQTTMTGPLSIQGVGPKIQADGYYWIQIVSPHTGYVALTTSYGNVIYTPPTNEDHLEIFVNGNKILDMTGRINAG